MGPDDVVEGLYVGKYGNPDIVSCLKTAQVNQLTFQATKEVLRHSVVIGIALTGHALVKLQGAEPFPVGIGGIL